MSEETKGSGADKAPVTDIKATPAVKAERRYRYIGPQYIAGAQKLVRGRRSRLSPLLMTDDEIDAILLTDPALLGEWWVKA